MKAIPMMAAPMVDRGSIPSGQQAATDDGRDDEDELLRHPDRPAVQRIKLMMPTRHDDMETYMNGMILVRRTEHRRCVQRLSHHRRRRSSCRIACA